MRNIGRYFFMGCVLYFAINWIADHPRLINKFRQVVNSSVDIIIDKSSEML